MPRGGQGVCPKGQPRGQQTGGVCGGAPCLRLAPGESVPGPCALGLAFQVCSLVASWAPLGRPHPSKTARVPLRGLSALHPPRLQEGTVKGHMAGSEVSLMTPASNQ